MLIRSLYPPSMVVYELICESGHDFEAYFPSFEAYQMQRSNGLVNCAVCGTVNVAIVPRGKAISVVSKVGESQESIKAPHVDPVTFIKSLNHYVKKNFEDVGERFPEEARKIYHGEKSPKNIYGKATSEEREMLHEEGVPIFAVPNLPEEVNN